MKKLFTVTLFICITALYGQITKNVGDFSKVTSFDKIEVTLIQGSENKVVISGKESASVVIINKNGELKVRMSIDKTLAGEDISVMVYYKDLTAIEANEGSIINSEGVIKAIGFDIIAKEGAVINIDLNVTKLSSKTSSGAIVNIDGNADNHNSIINAGGILNASQFKTLQTTVTCNAGGQAEVFATDYVNAKVRAGGNISIFGRPKQIDQKTVIGGTIEQK